MTGNKKILLTGATGFIGSHIAAQMLKLGHLVIATKRNNSNLHKCKEFSDQIIWINTDDENWDTKLAKLKPEIVIHAAWEGVKSEDRNNWDLQMANFKFTTKFFNASIEAGVKKIVSLGSQAEYGIFSERITEQYNPLPADAYGATKLHTCNYLRLLCQQKAIQWYWLRVFSVFGPGENDSWLLPQVMRSLRNGKAINLTKGEQKYDYMYINDFVRNLINIIDKNDSTSSGVYNFCSGTSIKLKDFLFQLANILDVSSDLLRFGTLPYRCQQSMNMEGDCSKFISTFGNLYATNIEQSLTETIDFYKNK
jgi:nucleoside-diphosphate-sugar epimerase